MMKQRQVRSRSLGPLSMALLLLTGLTPALGQYTFNVTGSGTINEGTSTTWTVYRDGTDTNNGLAVTVTSQYPDKANPDSPSIFFAGSTLSAPIQINGLDGGSTNGIVFANALYVTKTNSIKVNNLNPTISACAIPSSGWVGDSLSFSVTASDVPSDSSLTNTWNFGDGSVSNVIDSTPVFHTYANAGNFPVSVTVKDKDGGSALRSQTINIQQPTLSLTGGSVSEGASVVWTVTRTGPLANPLTVSLSTPAPNNISIPSNVSISTNVNSATFDVTGLDGGITNVIIAGASGYLNTTNSITVNNLNPIISTANIPTSGWAGDSLQFSVSATDVLADSSLTNTWVFGDGSVSNVTGSTVYHTYTNAAGFTATVTVKDKDGGSALRSQGIDIKQPFLTLDGGADWIYEGTTTTWTVTRNGPTAALLNVFLTNSALTNAAVPANCVIPATQASANFSITGLDGPGRSTVSATATTYVATTRAIDVVNLPPVITSVTVPTNGIRCTPLQFACTASDPGNDPISYSWSVDGVFMTNTPSFTASFATVMVYHVTLAVWDDDGATNTQNFSVDIKAGLALSVEVLPIGYDSLGGVGTGIWTASPPPNACGEYASGTVVRIYAIPTNYLTFESFFYEWGGDLPKGAVTNLPVLQITMDVNRNITLLFSREYYDYDQVGDLDHDLLPDDWEKANKLNPKDASGDEGANGNPDADFLPGLSYPLSSYCGTEPFSNVREARGLDGYWLANGPTGPVNNDDPYSDPKANDTDRDGFNDGYEYYFWRWRSGDPRAAVLSGNANLWWVTFNPVRYNSSMDSDGSRNPLDINDTDKNNELDDYYEYATSCTDPTTVDTDGDGMDDKWELDNGLDPLKRDDATDNPDGDKMAHIGDLYHDQVYRAGVQSMEAGETRFDPRTAWDGDGLDHPNTEDYRNFDEYLGRDRIGRIEWDNDGHYVSKPVDDSTKPMDNADGPGYDTDKDGIPDGWELYVGMNPNDDGDQELDGDGDNLSNSNEWANMQGVYGKPDTLGNWTNKLWPTDPGVIQDGTNFIRPNLDTAPSICFAWRNVWISTNSAARYDEGRDVRVYYGSNQWNTADGVTGCQAGVYYNDANGNGAWDWGEDIWKYINAVYTNRATNIFDGGNNVWSTTNGTVGIQTGLYYGDTNCSGSYSFDENIWRNDFDNDSRYDKGVDTRVWDGGYGDGWTAPDGAIGQSLPVYYDWFINKYVFIFWGRPGLTTNTPATPFVATNDAAWLDFDGNLRYDGEVVIKNGTPSLAAGDRGRGLMYVFNDTTNHYWYLPGGTGTAVNLKGSGVPASMSLVADVVFRDDNNNGAYDLTEPVWIDSIVADGLYTHDIQVYPTNQVLTGGERGRWDSLYFYHNDPHPVDTDYDGLEDGDGKSVDELVLWGEKTALSIPTTVDSDRDALPDGWELYAGTQILTPDASPGQVQNIAVNDDEDEDEVAILLDGLSIGTVEDPDGDGLVNNQEYFTGVVYEWMHLDINRFPNVKLCTRQPMVWDMENTGGRMSIRDDWMGVFIPPDFPTCPSFDVSNGQRARTAKPYVFYHTTKANNPDTDGDGMDDYWEVFHGLNPLKGACDYMAKPKMSSGSRSSNSGDKTGQITVNNDFSDAPHYKFGNSDGEFTNLNMVVAALASLSVSDHVGPFNMGLELMDPDADGLVNLEEYSYEPGDTGRSFYHTDPTAFIRTYADVPRNLLSTRPNSYSFTRDNYTFDNIECPCKWRWVKDSLVFPLPFEVTDGFDTDNDIYGDHAELLSTMPGSTGGSDPVDGRDPIRNRALFVAATNHDFVRTLDSWVVNTENHLTRFTVEAWVMPTLTGLVWQTAVERDTQLSGSDWLGSLTRSNFRLGLSTNNTPYVMYNGYGQIGFESFYACGAYSYRAPVNKWTHLAGTYDGTNLVLYVNGAVARSTRSSVIPATGYDDKSAQRDMSTTIIGASEPDSTNDLSGIPVPLFNDTVIGAGPRYGTAGYSLFSLSLQGERPVPVYATDFFNGYLDEIRVWNGARLPSEIQAAMRQKLGRTPSSTASTLEYYYGFDECPDVDVHWTNSLGQPVASEPRVPANLGTVQRPGMPIHRTLYTWDLSPQKSRVYYGSTNNPASPLRNHWNYMVMAEDYALHDAVIPPMDDHYHPVRGTNGSYTGEMPANYKNSANPYQYRDGITRWSWERPIRDLVFLNSAQADGDVFTDEAWWGNGPVQDPDARDTDGDGMPDDWESRNGLNPNSADDASGDLDEDGLNNLYEYWSHSDPRNPDSNGDGSGDAADDYDCDGLNNLMEQNIETMPNCGDTDDDGLSDGEEYTGADNSGSYSTAQTPRGTSNPLNSLDPPVRRSMRFAGDSRVIIPPQDKFMTENWTISLWANPTNVQAGTLINRYVEDTVSGNSGINYEMGVWPISGSSTTVMPYVMFQNRCSTCSNGPSSDITVILTLTNGVIPGCEQGIPVGKWSHLASTYNATNNRLELYVDGQLVSYRIDGTVTPALRYGLGNEHQGDQLTLGATRSIGTVANGFMGYIDEFKFYRTALTSGRIEETYNAPNSFGGGGQPAYRIAYKSRWFTPSPGLSDELAALPADEPVHAVVQFSHALDQTELDALTSSGLDILNRVSSRAITVRASPNQIETLSGVRWAGTLLKTDKLSPTIGSSGTSLGRNLLVRFFEGTTESNALAVAQSAGVSVYQGKYIAPLYIVVEADDAQAQALAQNDSVSWITKAGSFLTSGQAVRLMDQPASGRLESAPYALYGVGWDGPGRGSVDLTYWFNNEASTLQVGASRTAVVEAMNKWSAYAAIFWSRGSTLGLNYQIDNTWMSIDGPSGILAVAYYPNDINSEPIAGDMYFDADENWTLDKDVNFDLRFTALHELGHSLGLDHSDDPTAIMYPFYQAGIEPELRQDDISAIQALYAESDNAVAKFRFDDGGLTVEDFLSGDDWMNNWSHAGVLDGSSFATNEFAPLNADTDNDGMPDWWESAYQLNPLDASDATQDLDSDGVNNLNEYRAGTNPRTVYSNLSQGGTSMDDYFFDSDGDSLANGVEANYYNTDPGRADTDDDSLNDNVELTQQTDPSDSISPFVMRALRFGATNGAGKVTVSDRILGTKTGRFSVTNFTVECLVKADSFGDGNEISLISRRVECTGLLNFELGLRTNQLGRVPFIRFNDWAGRGTVEVVGGNPISADAWTHLAGRFDGQVLSLLVNGVVAGSDNTTLMPSQGVGDLVFGGTNFVGDLTEIRIWKIARMNEDIAAFKNRTIFFGAGAADAGLLRLQGNGSLRENSTTMDPLTGAFVDNLEYWTLETWVKTTGSGCLISRWNISQENAEDFNYFMGIDEAGRVYGRFSSSWEEVTDLGKTNESSKIVIDHDVNKLTGATPVNDGQWHHVAFVRNETNMLIYIDGELDGNGPNAWVTLTPADTVIRNWSIRIISGPVVIGTGLAGDMDEVRIWNRGLSAAELLSVMQNNLAGDEEGLVSYFSFDYQKGTNADERASMRDPSTEFGRYIPNALRVSTSDGPPVNIKPLYIYRERALIGYFAADDGGATVEDFIHPLKPEYAGVFSGDVGFAVLAAADSPFVTDSDGDGLPDWWETTHGLNPGSAIGVDGAWGDPDFDGLNNRAEYLAGTDPRDFDTYNTGFSDYDSWTNAGARTFGELYSDGDGMEDSWEAKYPGILSPLLYDAGEDPDNDGWSNFAEFMFAGTDTNGITVHSTSPADLNSHPIPSITFTFKSGGVLSDGPISVQAYHAATMDGTPDASVSITSSNGGVFPYSVSVRQWDQGWLREGQNWFFAFQDKNQDGTWNEGELAGLAQSQPINMGWGDVSNVVVGLTGTPQGYVRFSWAPVAGATAYTVTIRNVSGGNGTWVIPQRAVKAPRTYFHEGDFQLVGTNGLPHGTYDWFVSVSNGVSIDSNRFDVLYPVTQTGPVPSTPIGNLVFAQNEFTWSMDTNATQFRLQIATNSIFATILYDTIAVTPYRDSDGLYHYYAPLYAGDGWFTNRSYCWRLQGLNPRVNSAWSVAKPFTVNLQESVAGAYTISGVAYYFGKVTGGVYVAQAFRSAGFSGVPESQTTLTNKGPFKLMGLREGIYYVRVFIDQNNNRRLDDWESWGIVKDSIFQDDYSIKALAVPGNQSGQILVVRDRDTDNDNIPDAWEYLYFGNLIVASSVSDWDGDGLTDLREYEIDLVDTNPKLVDTDGDGISDYDEVWWDGSGDYNPYDPITNPTGTDLNPHKASTDGSGVPDGEQDTDFDSLNNTLELVMGTAPRTFTDLFGFAYPSVTIGNTADVIRFNIDNTVTNVPTNFTARPMWSTNLLSTWYLASNCVQAVNGSNWRAGPWVKTNVHAAGLILFYRVDWSSP